MSPAVTLITAAHKSEQAHLRAAVGSALRQSHMDIELIVSDDSPDDRLRDVVLGFRDSRLRYRRNEPALGVAANHWACLREARGEFVVILNHDDTLEPQFVDRLLTPLRGDASLALAFCDHWIIDATGQRDITATETASRRYGRAALAPGAHRPFCRLLLDQTIPMAMGTMFRRAALPDSLPRDAGPAYDLWLAYLLCRNGLGAWYVPERLSSWRLHAANQTTLGSLGLLNGAADCWAAVARDERMAAIRREARTRAARGYLSCATWCYRQGRARACGEYLRRSLRARVGGVTQVSP